MMMSFSASSISHKLSEPTSFFGTKLWVAILICVAFATAFSLLIITLWITCSRRRKAHQGSSLSKQPMVVPGCLCSYSGPSMDRRLLLSRNGREIEVDLANPEKLQGIDSAHSSNLPAGSGRVMMMRNCGEDKAAECWPSHRYTLEEMEAATNGFDPRNVISCGDHAIVYHGVLFNNLRVAVKRLLSNRGKAEDFMRQVEAVWCIRHRNLVKLLGFCVEGTYRVLVYEYADNGTLKHWLHDCTWEHSPLTWNIRMNIILGVAKGLAFLHEDTEPAVVHQNLTSSKILLDKQWNPKVLDFGITKLLDSEWSPILSSHVLVLDEKSDVYSFGILIMEIISGKSLIFDTATETEECLIDWIKSMVEKQKYDQLVDPRLPEMPSPVEFKRIILIALRCVDPDVGDRPKMGEVIHMLEPRDLLLSDERVIKKQTSRRSCVKEDDLLLPR
ncbi:PREDICTED: probable serine/threonine-protein kinase At1g01540 [Ipomoea nil]|uniref:probable serine/threonine-protein kinase At1g01540 n=1 Tax=Ipomoea nil TaxID=35883 RepID=UPI00090144D9|nr:PREDICTED: probable serine/threonine-protein kinase At1g01540 [Ipomoea nil]